MSIKYQSYYDQTIQIEDDADQQLGSNSSSYQKFCEAGFSDEESCQLVASGYSVLLDEIVVDRFHGGALLRCDGKTRFSLHNFREQFGKHPNFLPVHRAQKLDDVYRIVGDIRTRERRAIAFRGQTGHYPLRRPVPNSAFNHAALGEISLLPSVWRRVLNPRMSVWHTFRDLMMMEWSAIMYDMFDISNIYKIEQQAGLLPGYVDLDDIPEDTKFQKLRDFHSFRKAFLEDYGFGSSAPLLTLLQHYGLHSPVLDLTTSLEVALFFATHKFSQQGELSRYDFVGTNQRRSIIYVLLQDRNETLEYQRGKLLETLDPQRPHRQACVIMHTNQYAMNLAADFLIAAIHLDFDLTESGKLSVADLFPDEDEDRMLAAFKRRLSPDLRCKVTTFS